MLNQPKPADQNLQKVVPAAPNNGTVSLHAQAFSGPLPHPDLLFAYERSLPGLGDRIVRMAETEQVARIEREKRETFVAGWLQIAGQVGALILSGVSIFAGYELLMHDKSIAGFTFFLGAAGTLIGTAMYRHKHSSQPKQ